MIDPVLCRQLSKSGAEKYADVGFRLSLNGSPILDGVIARIDCDNHQVTEVGDRFLVPGLVKGLEAKDGRCEPMLFFRGRYDSFANMELLDQ